MKRRRPKQQVWIPSDLARPEFIDVEATGDRLMGGRGRGFTATAADLFGAASVKAGHPMHKFSPDAWTVSLAESTQDVKKRSIPRWRVKRRAT